MFFLIGDKLSNTWLQEYSFTSLWASYEESLSERRQLACGHAGLTQAVVFALGYFQTALYLIY